MWDRISRLLTSFGYVACLLALTKTSKLHVSKDINLCGFVSHKNQAITTSIFPHLFQRFLFVIPEHMTDFLHLYTGLKIFLCRSFSHACETVHEQAFPVPTHFGMQQMNFEM